MRKVLFVVLVLMLSLVVNAQDSGIGIGISWSGLNGKYWMDESTALTVQLSSNAIAADYLLHKADMLKITDAPTPVYYGAGAVLGTHDEWNFEQFEFETKLDIGIRGVIGLSYHLSAYPIDIFLEDTPTFYALGGKGLDLVNFTFGVRYFF